MFFDIIKGITADALCKVPKTSLLRKTISRFAWLEIRMKTCGVLFFLRTSLDSLISMAASTWGSTNGCKIRDSPLLQIQRLHLPLKKLLQCFYSLLLHSTSQVLLQQLTLRFPPFHKESVETLTIMFQIF